MAGGPLFYVGLHHPSSARQFARCLVSVNVLKDRVGDFPASEWMLDSGAFTQVALQGGFSMSPVEYAAQVVRWSRVGKLVAAVSQDYMCEPKVLAKTGQTVFEHQRLTIGRFLAIQSFVGSAAYVMLVLQGYAPEEYVEHVRQYGALLGPGRWVGVGSVCKRNANLEQIENVLVAIKEARPDLRLHGFGVKTTALASSIVRACLHSADSMAWSFAARYEGRDGNSWREAEAFRRKIEEQPVKARQFQRSLW